MSLAVVLAEAITGDIDVMAIVQDLGSIAEDLATTECAAPNAIQFLMN